MDRANDKTPRLTHNFIMNVLDGAVYALGMSLVSRTTVLPLFVHKLGGGSVAVGLIPVLWWIGFSFPQLLIAGPARRAASKRRLLLQTSLVQRLPWLLLALISAFAVQHVGPSVGLALFLGGFLLAAVAGSINLPVWFDVVAQVTPVRLRGRLFGTRAVLWGLFGILGGWTAAQVLEQVEYPFNFAALLGVAFALTMVSYVFIALLKIPSTAPRPDRPIRMAVVTRSLRAALRKRPNYRKFLVAEALVMTAISVEAFYMVDALETFDLSEGYAGRFTMVAMGAAMFGSLVFGYIADHFGHRINLILAAGFIAFSCVVALVAPTVEIYGLAFAGAALTLGIRSVSQLPIIAELCGEQDRPTYIALANMITSPFVLSGILAGWVANQVGYEAVFVAGGLVALAAVVWLLVMVEEPRRQIPAHARMPTVPAPMR